MWWFARCCKKNMSLPIQKKSNGGWPSLASAEVFAPKVAQSVAGVQPLKVSDVRWRRIEITADMFRTIKENGEKPDYKHDASVLVQDTVDGNILDGEKLLDYVCDYTFMMGFKRGSGGNTSALQGEMPVSIMSRYGFLPLGIARASAFGEKDTLFVLIRDREDPLPARPYLRPDVYTRLCSLVSGYVDRTLCITLLWTESTVLGRVIDYLYHQIDLGDGIELENDAKEPLSIDVQAGETGPIMQARFWLREALNRQASDIHIEPLDGSGRVRLRVKGYLELLQDRVSVGDLTQMITWIKAQARMDISERRKPLDGSIRVICSDSGAPHIVDVRISTVPTIYGQKMVLRLLDPDMLKNLSRRGLAGTIWDEDLRIRFEKALVMRDGIVLVTGPTGSGKTTTLNVSLMHLLDSKIYGDTRNIVTIEDPVEYSIPGANQTQVNEQAGVTFARTLRSLLRQDPDIVLIGEIRDSETAQIAVQASLTGHLILATLHTNDSLGAVDRLRDLGVSPFLIGSTLRLVQAQRLVRKLCRNCGSNKLLSTEDLERKVDASRLSQFKATLLAEGTTVFEPSRCARCGFTGYDTRAAVMEMACSTPELVKGIEKEVSSRELAMIARKSSGFRPMLDNGIDMVCKGVTTLDEIETISLNLQMFEL